MDEAISVTHNSERQQYDITVDGEPAGFSAYRDIEQDGQQQRILYHTVIHDEFGGRGMASTLTREAIEHSVSEGLRVVPVCPYVKNWVQKHDDFTEHIDPVTNAHLALFQ